MSTDPSALPTLARRGELSCALQRRDCGLTYHRLLDAQESKTIEVNRKWLDDIVMQCIQQQQTSETSTAVENCKAACCCSVIRADALLTAPTIAIANT